MPLYTSIHIVRIYVPNDCAINCERMIDKSLATQNHSSVCICDMETEQCYMYCHFISIDTANKDGNYLHTYNISNSSHFTRCSLPSFRIHDIFLYEKREPMMSLQPIHKIKHPFTFAYTKKRKTRA